jgi:hypothetical protein
MGMKAASLVCGGGQREIADLKQMFLTREGCRCRLFLLSERSRGKGMAKRAKSPAEQKSTQTYHFRVYPTHKQERTLEQWLVLCCETYHAALDERKRAYRLAGVSLSYEEQCAALPGCKEMRPDLAQVPSQAPSGCGQTRGSGLSGVLWTGAGGPKARLSSLQIAFSLSFADRSRNVGTGFRFTPWGRRSGARWN